MGFEPTRAEHNGLAVHRLNHSATLSTYLQDLTTQALTSTHTHIPVSPIEGTEMMWYMEWL